MAHTVVVTGAKGRAWVDLWPVRPLADSTSGRFGLSSGLYAGCLQTDKFHGAVEAAALIQLYERDVKCHTLFCPAGQSGL
jgi:hypothetical protein